MATSAAMATQATLVAAFGALVAAQERPPDAPAARASAIGAPPEVRLGVLQRTAGAAPGYTLFAPFNQGDTFLIDLAGAVVKRWHSDFPPGQAVELLDNGHLLRAARDPAPSPLRGGGEGGRLEEFDWDGNLIWTWICCDDDRRQHHDFEPLQNGNVLVIAWERKSVAEAVEAGCDLAAAKAGIHPDCVLEVAPTRPLGGTIVWEWHVWDHLIQDRDPAKANFGVVAEHPERIDVNAGRPRGAAPSAGMSPEETEQLRRLGYLGGEDDAGARGQAGGAANERPSPPSPPTSDGELDPRRRAERDSLRRPGMGADWNHLNAVNYHAGLDQIVLSSHNQHEVWIVDHGTTTEEAAGSSGGKRGAGGDLLWRWGNPQIWQAGDAAMQQLFGQHDARWIELGRRGAGHLLIFNNNMRGGGFGGPPGPGRRGREEAGGVPTWSHVVELETPLQPDGRYARTAGEPFAPAQPLWRYGGGPGEATFRSPIVSGSQRLANGNTLITSGAEGYCVEVDAEGQVVWEYRSPFGREAGATSRGGPPGAPPSGPGEDGAGAPRVAPAFGGPGVGGRGGPGGIGGMGAAFFRAIRIEPDHPALRGRSLKPEPKGT